MKDIRLIIKNTIHFIRHRKMQAAILTIGHVIAAMVLLFAIGTCKMMVFDKEGDFTNYTDDKYYYMYLRDTDSDVTPQEWLQYIMELRDWIGKDLESADMYAWTNSDENTYLSTYYTQDYEDEGYPERLDDIPVEVLNSDSNIIYTPKFWKSKEGDTCTVGDKKYTVAGETEMQYPLIPNKAFPEGYKLTSLSMYIGGMVTVERNNQIVAWLKKCFGSDVEVQSPEKADLMQTQINNSIYVIIAIASIVVLLNILICYIYIVWDGGNMIRVYKLTGCSDIKAFVIYAVQFIIEIVLSYTFGLVMFRKFVYPVMVHNNGYYMDIYGMRTYAFAVITFVLINFVLISTVLIRQIRKGVIAE